MIRRVTARGGASSQVHEDTTLLRQQLSRRTQLRLQVQRRQTARQHDQALIRNAQHAIPHEVKTDSKRSGRQLLLAQLEQRTPQAPEHPAHHLHVVSADAHRHVHHAPADAQPQQAVPPAPLAISDQEQGRRGGSGGQQTEQQGRQEHPRNPERGGDDATDGMTTRPARRRAIRGVTGSRMNARRGQPPAATDLQQFLAAQSRAGPADGSMIAKAWAQALLKAVGDASPPRTSAVDAALGCLDDLLAGWQHHGELLAFNPGAVLAQFLPVLRAHVPPAGGGADRPYALLPLMLISGFRNRNGTELKSARVRIHNQRLARLVPATG